jgi:putative ABC transport system substrate-binding protein
MTLAITRRQFATALGGAAVWPIAARGQEPIPVVGFLMSREPGEDPHLVGAFRQGLNESGFVERRNVTIEYRSGLRTVASAEQSAADLVSRQVNVIAAIGDGMALAAQAATASIPTVFVTGVDPVEYGLVASLNRPGGNRTGVSMLNAQLGPKRLQLLRELIPSAAVIGLLAISHGAMGWIRSAHCRANAQRRYQCAMSSWLHRQGLLCDTLW